MTGGTDHDIDPGEGHWAARLLWRERVADLAYDARAKAQTLAWTAIFAGLGMFFTGLATHDSALFASGITAVVVAFIPRCRPLWAYQVAMTWAMARGWTAVPAEERPLRSPDEILAKRVKPVVDVRVRDEI
jgi:hypothetical protein